mmetsp:Transcript_22184/g.33869  ORF Transcript_22184/g.33869 Transcript_22184/m.33869 type:complete len:80 (-) Transcript_22184:722-961(-)
MFSSKYEARLPLLLNSGIHVGNEIQDSVGVAALIVVPGNKFDEILRQGNTSLLVEDGGASITNEVRGDNSIRLISHNST